MISHRPRVNQVIANLDQVGSSGSDGASSLLSSATETWRLRVSLQTGTALVRWYRYGLGAALGDDSANVPVVVDGGSRTWAVERSASPCGPFYEVVTGLHVDSRTWVDTDVPLRERKNRSLYYRIVAYDSDAEGETTRKVWGLTSPWEWASDNRIDFGVSWTTESAYDSEAPAAVREIRRRHSMTMLNRNGERLLLYREMWDAPARRDEIDPLTGAITFSRQPGQDYSGRRGTGFYPPVEVFMGREGNSGGGTMLHWPPPELGDRLRNHAGDVSEIVAIDPVAAYGYPVHWQVQLAELPDTDIVAEQPLPDHYLSLSPYPRRQFSRVTNLESYALAMSHGSSASASIDPKPDAERLEVDPSYGGDW